MEKFHVICIVRSTLFAVVVHVSVVSILNVNDNYDGVPRVVCCCMIV